MAVGLGLGVELGLGLGVRRGLLEGLEQVDDAVDVEGLALAVDHVPQCLAHARAVVGEQLATKVRVGLVDDRELRVIGLGLGLGLGMGLGLGQGRGLGLG